VNAGEGDILRDTWSQAERHCGRPANTSLKDRGFTGKEYPARLLPEIMLTPALCHSGKKSSGRPGYPRGACRDIPTASGKQQSEGEARSQCVACLKSC